MATLISPTQFSAGADAEALHKAFQGWGTDEKSVIAILGHRNVHQRQQIRKAYEAQYQEDLIKRLESELSGHFERAIYRWMLEEADRDAVLANVAIRDGIKGYNVIVEIASVLSPQQLFAMRLAYQNRYKRSLEEDIASNTSFLIRQLLVGLVSSYRYGGEEINAKLAKTEADVLYESVKQKNGNYEEAIRILTTRSKTQLMATFNRYRDEHGSNITKKLLDVSSDEFHKAMHTAIRCLKDPHKYYEKVLRNAIKKGDEDALTRVVVSRGEKDMKHIKELYYKRNSVHLEEAITKTTSGDYKKFILTLLGKQLE
ncbi:hypothetical protein PIB30_027783 [Stylosanthes scabra]|uniref:Annexin n=1 Tax=Stylosanthes scabra TaxID=79078 RepID=A0ABU6QC58_9FABA|nr:hypothetical protein [Stylosanthes scabra]